MPYWVRTYKQPGNSWVFSGSRTWLGQFADIYDTLKAPMPNPDVPGHLTVQQCFAMGAEVVTLLRMVLLFAPYSKMAAWFTRKGGVGLDLSPSLHAIPLGSLAH